MLGGGEAGLGQDVPETRTLSPPLWLTPRTPGCEGASPTADIRGFKFKDKLREYGHRTPNKLGVGSGQASVVGGMLLLQARAVVGFSASKEWALN